MRESGRLNILLVDDHPLILAELARQLREDDGRYELVTAGNGEAAIGILETTAVDLVVTDLKMPVLDGIGLVSHMRVSHPNVPVIVMSSCLDAEMERRLVAVGIPQCVDKARIGALRTAIADSLEGRREGAAQP